MSKKQEVTMERAFKDYSWLGEVVCVHHVGPYDIVEYWSRPAVNSKRTHDIREFGLYVNDDKTSISFDSLDAALAGGIAYRALGPNCQASYYFMRGIGANAEPETRPSANRRRSA